MPLKHGQRDFLARRREGAVEVLKIDRRQGDVAGRAVGAHMRRLHRFRDCTTPGWLSSQASAICAGVASWRAATAFSVALPSRRVSAGGALTNGE